VSLISDCEELLQISPEMKARSNAHSFLEGEPVVKSLDRKEHNFRNFLLYLE